MDESCRSGFTQYKAPSFQESRPTLDDRPGAQQPQLMSKGTGRD